MDAFISNVHRYKKHMKVTKKKFLILFAVCILLIFNTVTASAQENSEIGYIDLSHDGIRAFSNKEFSKSGYMDEEGNIIVPCEYTLASDFTNGFGLICKEDANGKVYSVVNTKGELTLTFDPQLGDIDYYNGNGGIATKFHDAYTAGRSALIDGKGKLITGYDYYSLLEEKRSPGYGVLWAEKIHSGETDAKRGVLDWGGKAIVPLEYFDINKIQSSLNLLKSRELYHAGDISCDITQCICKQWN